MPPDAPTPYDAGYPCAPWPEPPTACAPGCGSLSLAALALAGGRPGAAVVPGTDVNCTPRVTEASSWPAVASGPSPPPPIPICDMLKLPSRLPSRLLPPPPLGALWLLRPLPALWPDPATVRSCHAFTASTRCCRSAWACAMT
jgi:hypothetical protein